MPARAPARRPRKARNPRGQGERLREDLLDAANDVLLEVGSIDRLSIRAVTRRAGVSPMALYLHFEDRTALVQAVMRRNFGELVARLEAAEDSVDDPVEALRRGCAAYVAFGTERPEAYRVMFELPDDEDAVEVCAEEPLIGLDAFEVLVRGIARCVAAGRAPDRDPFRTATEMWLALHGLVTLRSVATKFPWPEGDLLGDLLVRVVGVESPAA